MTSSPFGVRLNREQAGNVFDGVAHIDVEDFEFEFAGFDL